MEEVAVALADTGILWDHFVPNETDCPSQKHLRWVKRLSLYEKQRGLWTSVLTSSESGIKLESVRQSRYSPVACETHRPVASRRLKFSRR